MSAGLPEQSCIQLPSFDEIIADMISNVDRDGNNEIDLEEFIAMMLKHVSCLPYLFV